MSARTWKMMIGATGLAVVLGGAGLVLGDLFASGPHDPAQADMRLDSAMRAEVVATIADNLDRYYVYPEKAAAVGAHLDARLRHGDFDAVTSAEAFAAMLSADLQAQTQDRHLQVRYFEKPVPVLPPGQDQTPEQEAEERLEAQRFNAGFETVGRLRGNIGYIQLRSFSRPAQTADRIVASMTLIADTKALIIDLRKTHGGDPETVMLFASYLFDAPTHLNDIAWREGDRIEERWTQKDVVGPRYGQARRIFVLTSRGTFSAGEDFAYALKYAGRAIVIGETTGGGAHPGNARRLDDHFMMFVPCGRAINPVTHTDWEVVGVEPDVAADADDALTVAHIAALKEIAAAETDEDWKQGLLSEIDKLD